MAKYLRKKKNKLLRIGDKVYFFPTKPEVLSSKDKPFVGEEVTITKYQKYKSLLGNKSYIYPQSTLQFIGSYGGWFLHCFRRTKNGKPITIKDLL